MTETQIAILEEMIRTKKSGEESVRLNFQLRYGSFKVCVVCGKDSRFGYSQGQCHPDLCVYRDKKYSQPPGMLGIICSLTS